MRCAPPTPMPPRRAEISSPPDCARIFCVDDDPVAQRLLMATLVRRGWTVECACDGQEALDRFLRDRCAFDVLVTDHAMPRLDGLSLVRQLRAAGFGGAVIVVSAHLGSGERTAYQALGVTAFFPKPFPRAGLLAAVRPEGTAAPVRPAS